MDRDELEEYLERAQDIVDEAPQMSEANTKEMLVRPFLEVLGWEFRPSEVRLEYPVRMASTRTKVDYALMLDGTPVAFVEAKGLDTALNDDHREQVTSYMHNEEGVEWGLLTNGRQYEFFMYDGTPTAFSLGGYELDDLAENSEVVGTLSKQSVSSGESRDKAERLRERERAVSTLRDDKDEMADEITGAVTERIGESVAPVVETEAKEFVDRVIEELENGGTETEEADTDSAIVGKLSRNDIDGEDDAKVAIFPTKESGIEFLKENNAWGFVRIGDEPDYVGMYVAAPQSKVRFFAEVDDIVPANDAELAKPPRSYTDKAKFDSDKKVVKFKPESLYELADSIPHKEKTPYSLRYTDLRSLKDAETTEDIL